MRRAEMRAAARARREMYPSRLLRLLVVPQRFARVRDAAEVHRDFAAGFTDGHRDCDARAAAADASAGGAWIVGAVAGAYGIELPAAGAAPPFDRTAWRRGKPDGRAARGAGR